MTETKSNKYDPVPSRGTASETPAQKDTEFGFEKRISKDIERLNTFFIGLIIFVAVTFVLFMYETMENSLRDKDIVLKYSDIADRYSERNLETNKKLWELQGEIDLIKEKQNIDH